ncbi:MAG: hypothetical protein WC476_13120 [Phycisphaerae bacterium]
MNLGVKIYALLGEGHSVPETVKLLKCSSSLVWKHAKKYVKKGELERISKYPAQFRKSQTKYTHIQPVGDMNTIQPPIDIPCKFGASFAQVGNPPLLYNHGKAKDEQATHIAIFGKHKTVIWLRAGFRGETPDEIIENGNETLKSFARDYEQRFGISLAYLRTFLDIEWIMVNMAAGKRISKYEGLKNKQRKEIAGAWHKQGDSSHPRHRQYQAIANQDPIMPTEHATIDHYLYSGQFARDMFDLKEIAKEMTGEYSENIKSHLAAIKELRDAIRELNEIKKDKGLAPKEESK